MCRRAHGSSRMREKEMSQPLIALFTDFGQRDVYVAQIKGAILSLNPQALLVDLSHDVGQFDVPQAAYLLEKAVRYFPAGTIVVAVVDPGVGSVRRPLLVSTRAGKFYVGPDNGLFTWILERERLQEAYALEQEAYFRTPWVSATFHGRDIFAPVAAHLSLGVAPTCFGQRLTEVVTLPCAQPQVAERTVTGVVLHIDHFGNILTNVPATCLDAIRRGQDITVTISDATHTMPFCHTYADREPGTLIGLINSNEEFELACTQGRATDLVSARVGDRVVVTWT
jgi:S-adenosyl-L-methionine hydrolase (adenosine-forming)